MRVCDMATKSENFSDLNLPISALYLLAAPSAPAGVRDEIMERAGAGEDIKVADVKKAIGAAKQHKPLKTFTSVPKATARPTHLDVIAAWNAALPAERSKAVDAIGLHCLLAAIPDEWWPLIEKRLADRHHVNASAGALSDPTSGDLSIPEFLRRKSPNAAGITPASAPLVISPAPKPQACIARAETRRG
jgi:hypothetical protein